MEVTETFPTKFGGMIVLVLHQRLLLTTMTMMMIMNTAFAESQVLEPVITYNGSLLEQAVEDERKRHYLDGCLGHWTEIGKSVHVFVSHILLVILSLAGIHVSTAKHPPFPRRHPRPL